MLKDYRKIGGMTLSRYKEGDYTIDVKRSPDIEVISYRHRDRLVEHLKEIKEISPSK